MARGDRREEIRAWNNGEARVESGAVADWAENLLLPVFPRGV